MRALRAVLVLALLVGLSGCAGKSDSSSASSPASGTAAPQAVGLQPPVLHVGDWWNFTTPGGATSYVVAKETSDDYIFGTDNGGLAYFNTLSDVSNLGPQRKSDLAGSQGNVRVQFFQWPLVDGKNWTTTWDGEPITIKAKVAGQKADFVATHANGTLYATYSYDNRTRWFTAIDFKDAQGQSAFAIKLQASGSKFPGTVKSWDVKPIIHLQGSLAAVPPQPATYDVPLTATDVFVTASIACTQGAANIGTSPEPFAGGIAGTDPRGGGVGGEPCPSTQFFSGSAGAPQAPPQGGATETWGYSVSTTPATTGTYSLDINVRTLHSDPVTS